eukprot:scaffold4061_cov108-Cylindrotheca_fusiformis.AAC.7
MVALVMVCLFGFAGTTMTMRFFQSGNFLLQAARGKSVLPGSGSERQVRTTTTTTSLVKFHD